MNTLEILGIIFLGTLIINIIVWFIAVKNPAVYIRLNNFRLQNRKEKS